MSLLLLPVALKNEALKDQKSPEQLIHHTVFLNFLYIEVFIITNNFCILIHRKSHNRLPSSLKCEKYISGPLKSHQL